MRFKRKIANAKIYEDKRDLYCTCAAGAVPGLVKRISDREPTARQVPDTTLDSQLKEGITYLEHLALGVSLDSGPMEGMSCLEPLEESILQSWIARPCNCVL